MTEVGTKEAAEEKTPMCEKELDINLEDLVPPVPPDGGWSWMVLLGSVICMFFVDGLSFSFGVILSDIQADYNCSKTKISLAGSLIVGCTLISGKVTSQPPKSMLLFRSDCQCDIKQVQFPSPGHCWIVGI